MAGQLGANNAFAPGTPNAGIDAAWGREAALLPNNPVLPKFRNCGFKRESVGAAGASRVIRHSLQLIPSLCAHRFSLVRNDKFIIAPSVVLPVLTPSSRLLDEKNIDFALCNNCVWVVLFAVASLTSEDVKSKLKTLRGQFDVIFNFYSPLVRPAHHFIAGPLALNTKILQYGTAKDQLPPIALMNRLLTAIGLCFDSLKESNRTPYNVAWHDSMIDYNARGGTRVAPKPPHRDAWKSPKALLQFAIDVYG